MENRHIESYLQLRQELSRSDWEDLNELYEYHIHEKERRLTKDLSLDICELKALRSNAQRLMGISE